MKRIKNRLHRVIVIGATPAGLVATNKLGELGIPVTLIDPDPDLDRKLSREEWRLESGVSFNFAHRPGILRILRNPLINNMLPADVVSLKHTPQGFSARVRRIQTFVDPDRCVLCGRCAQVCPVVAPDGEKPILFHSRRSIPGRLVIDKRPLPPCRTNCPLGVNAQAYIALASTGRFREAMEVLRRDNVLPGICGRLCTHPCEEACRRGDLDEPIAIRDIKRFLADFELSNPHDLKVPDVEKRPEAIAVIGSGPAGLAASADLARFGYQVTIFEKEEMAGGLLRYGISPHRLPRDILDYELEFIRKLGVHFKTSHPLDLSKDLDKLKKDFDAVVLATGTWSDRRLGVPGEDLAGVEGCLSFLNRLYRAQGEELREEVAVIGDGNAAFDLARALRRLGAGVTILSWFSKDMIPADLEEIRGALEEGVKLTDSTRVTLFSGRNGRLESLQCKPTKPGRPDDQGIAWPVVIPEGKSFDLKFDRAIVAIGQTGTFPKEGYSLKNGRGDHVLDVTEKGLIKVNLSLGTSIPGIYATGDTVTGPSSIVEAMASGRMVARSIHKEISGDDASAIIGSRPEDKDFSEISSDIPSLARPKMPERQPAARCDDSLEVALGLSKAQTIFEAERCLQCGICSDCLICSEVCRPIGAINHLEKSEETIEHSGAIIIADPSITPSIRGEDVIRAYDPRLAKPNVHAMITRGFAAAANAMILLEETSHRPRGSGVSFALPDPGLHSDTRIGVFVCRCNDAFGWLDEMSEYVDLLVNQEEIVHAEVVNSACVPEGSVDILKTIREKDITRVVLASCVCCPLDFICTACTDQRSRLKEALFKGSGVSRSMFETCNLRGEVLRDLQDDGSVALNRFRGLISRSISRANKLRPLPAPARSYNFTTAIIGESEAALNSAKTLAEAGLEVFMFGTRRRPLTEKSAHINIHYFENSSVKALSGTLGNFQVFVESGDFSQVLQVGTVIIGEKFRQLIPYIPQEDMRSRLVTASIQKRGVPGTPFLYPGMTSIAGLFLASPPGINVSERKKGSAAAVLAAAIMPRGPRQSKGYTVVVDEDLCRGCGRCIEVCPYQAIIFRKNSVGGWFAVVDEALCKGCGNCISACPSNAADSPYRDQIYLEQLLEEVLAQ